MFNFDKKTKSLLKDIKRNATKSFLTTPVLKGMGPKSTLSFSYPKHSLELIKGGLGDYKQDRVFNPRQLKMGMKVEMEHTTNPKIAKEIAKDHLTEYPNYYTHLAQMENKLKREGFPKAKSVRPQPVPPGWDKYQKEHHEKVQTRAVTNFFKDDDEGFKPWMRKKSQKEIEEEIEDEYISEQNREYREKQKKLKRKQFGKNNIAHLKNLQHLQSVKEGKKDIILISDEEANTLDTDLPYLEIPFMMETINGGIIPATDRIYYHPNKKQEAEKAHKLFKDVYTSRKYTPEYHIKAGYILGYSKPEVYQFVKKTFPNMPDDKIWGIINNLEKVDNIHDNLLNDNDGDGVNNVLDCDPNNPNKQGYIHNGQAVLYHGTTREKANKIINSGLKVQENMFGEPAVFLTPSFQHAVYHGTKKKYVNPNIKPAVLEVSVPRNEVNLTDEQILDETHPTREVKIYRNIPPQNIRLSGKQIQTSWGDSDKDGILNVFDKPKQKRKEFQGEFDPYGTEEEEIEWMKQNERERKSIEEEYY